MKLLYAHDTVIGADEDDQCRQSKKYRYEGVEYTCIAEGLRYGRKHISSLVFSVHVEGE